MWIDGIQFFLNCYYFDIIISSTHQAKLKKYSRYTTKVISTYAVNVIYLSSSSSFQHSRD